MQRYVRTLIPIVIVVVLVVVIGVLLGEDYSSSRQGWNGILFLLEFVGPPTQSGEDHSPYFGLLVQHR